MKIRFYDVSASQELAHLNSQILTFGELYDFHLASRQSWPALVLDRESFCAHEFHPYASGENGWKSWENHFSTAVQLVCGHVPSKDELKVIRQYLRQLPNDFKRSHVDRGFVLSFLPYLCAGFKSHTFDTFASDSNAVNALIQFTVSLWGSEKIFLSSFLCSHREPKAKPGEPLNLLQSHIPPHKVRRAVALSLALVANSREQPNCRAIFLQQDASYRATSSIFPEVTATYLEDGRAYEMIDRLRYQHELVNQVLLGMSQEGMRVSLVSLDVLTSRIERFLSGRFGPDWRNKDFTGYQFREDPIVQIALDMALPDIKRMMPFFSGDFQSSFLAQKENLLQKNGTEAYKIGGQKLADLASRMVEWFILQHSMTISAKAVYETVFYYLWGKYCGRFEGAFAIGFDRDHEAYQHFAWRLGAESEKRNGIIRQSVPLYARRNPSGRKHGALVDLTYRQFWRSE